jgi:hypothetical protein
MACGGGGRFQGEVKMKKVLIVVVGLLLLGASILSAEGRVPANAKLFVEGSETVDASNSKNKATYGDFTLAITAALAKKKVPVVVVTDVERADFVVRHTSSAKEDSTGTKIAKIAVMGGLWGSSKFEASIMVIDKASTAVVYSYNVKKGNFQSAAESFAKNLNNNIAGK